MSRSAAVLLGTIAFVAGAAFGGGVVAAGCGSQYAQLSRAYQDEAAKSRDLKAANIRLETENVLLRAGVRP